MPPLTHEQILRFLSSVHPYDAMPTEAVAAIEPAFEARAVAAGDTIYALGQPLDGLFIIYEGEVEVTDENDVVVSHLGLRNTFGERGLLREGTAVTAARAVTDTTLLMLPAAGFHKLIAEQEVAARFFDRSRGDKPVKADLATTQVDTLMAANPVTCVATDTVQDAARLMRDRRVSSLCVTAEGKLSGILTTRDLSGKVLAEALPITTPPVADVMTENPITLAPPSAIGSDVLHAMMERRIGHIPIVESGKLVGIVTQTDLTRFQAVSSAELVSEIAHADTAEEMAKVTARIPQLLVQLVAGGRPPHQVVTRLITDIADTATRRLLMLAEEKLGPPRRCLTCGWPAARRADRNRPACPIRTTA